MVDDIIRLDKAAEDESRRLKDETIEEQARTIAAERRKAELQAKLGEMRLLMAEARHAEETIARATADKARMAEIRAGVDHIGGQLSEARSQAQRAEDLAVRLVSAAARAPEPPLAPASPPKPLASELVEPFFKRRAETDKATHQVMGQERGTLRRFMEICGDRPVDTYGRGDITHFLATMRRMPAVYGRSPKDKDATVAELIARADSSGGERLSDKTLKRHLSTLAQFFQVAVDLGHLPETVLRAKGLLCLPYSPDQAWLIQCVGRRVDVSRRAMPPDATEALVLIGTVGITDAVAGLRAIGLEPDGLPAPDSH